MASENRCPSRWLLCHRGYGNRRNASSSGLHQQVVSLPWIAGGQEIVFLLVLLTSALFDIAYFFPIIYNSFFREPEHKIETGISEASMLMVIPIAVCAAISILLGIAPDAFVRFFSIASLAAKGILGVKLK